MFSTEFYMYAAFGLGAVVVIVLAMLLVSRLESPEKRRRRVKDQVLKEMLAAAKSDDERKQIVAMALKAEARTRVAETGPAEEYRAREKKTRPGWFTPLGGRPKDETAAFVPAEGDTLINLPIDEGLFSAAAQTSDGDGVSIYAGKPGAKTLAEELAEALADSGEADDAGDENDDEEDEEDGGFEKNLLRKINLEAEELTAAAPKECPPDGFRPGDPSEGFPEEAAEEITEGIMEEAGTGMGFSGDIPEEEPAPDNISEEMVTETVEEAPGEDLEEYYN